MKNIIEIGLNLNQKILQELKILEMNTFELFKYLEDFSKKSCFFTLPLEEDIYIEKTESVLEDYLLDQINLLNIEKKIKGICCHFVENLDDKGYLKVSFTEISQKYGIDIYSIKKSHKVFKGLEPKGIGARNLKEALIVQAEEFPDLEEVLLCAYEDLISMRIDKVGKKLGISIERVKEIISPMREFISYPRRDFAGKIMAHTRTSDIIVSGNLKVSLNKKYDLRIEEASEYSNYGSSSSLYKKEKRVAFTINLALEKRKKTLLNLGEFIVNYQKDYFNGGSMKPLIQEKIAETLNVSTSTISRACKDKVLEYRGKQFEMKEFFPRKVAADNSSWEVKRMIKELIDNEDRRSPLSDEDIKKDLS